MDGLIALDYTSSCYRCYMFVSKHIMENEYSITQTVSRVDLGLVIKRLHSVYHHCINLTILGVGAWGLVAYLGAVVMLPLLSKRFGMYNER